MLRGQLCCQGVWVEGDVAQAHAYVCPIPHPRTPLLYHTCAKVYNVTPYLRYHPGGAQILADTAGTDCTQLFNE